MINEQYKYSELTGKIIKCAMTVHSSLGSGFQEVIYQRALSIEILYDTTYKTIDFFDINSPIKGNGSKMVDAVLQDFPKDWQPAVVMYWSNGFWKRMEEKYKQLNWMM